MHVFTIFFSLRIVPKLFYSCDHPQHDPIITESRLHTEKMLCPMVSDLVLNPPPLVLGLTKPFSVSNRSVSSHIESNLSRVVIAALHQLNMSQSKHLTVCYFLTRKTQSQLPNGMLLSKQESTCNIKVFKVSRL